jgi:hypothetical protein
VVQPAERFYREVLWPSIALILSLGIGSEPSYADTDIPQFLDAALAKKNILVNRTRQVTGQKLSCSLVADGRPHKDCQTIEYTYTQTYQDNARVKSGQVINISQLRFDPARLTQLPGTVLVDRLNYINCGEDQFNPAFNLSVTGTESHSVSKTQTVSSTVGVQVDQTFTAGNGLFGGSTSIQVNFSMTLSNSTTNQETSSTATTQGYSGTILAAVGHAGYAQLAAVQQGIEVPFSATVTVDGDMEDNISGYNKVSQLLAVQERTLPFSGTLTAGGLSDAFTGLFKPDEPFNCSDPKYKGQQTATYKKFQVPLTAMSGDLAKDFGTIKETFAKRPSQTTPQQLDNDAATTSTTIESTEVYVRDPACGFDDVGHPKTAIHLVELKHYTTHVDGTLHQEWDEPTEKFVKCSPIQ